MKHDDPNEFPRTGTRLRDEDLELLFRYLDDELEEDESLRFELRLSETPELADEFERLAAVDGLQRDLFPGARRASRGPWRGPLGRLRATADPDAPRTSGSGRGGWSWWVAAAVLVAASGALAFWSGGGGEDGPRSARTEGTVADAGSPAAGTSLEATVLAFERQLMDEAARRLGDEVATATLRGPSGADRDGAAQAGAVRTLVQALAAAEESRAEEALAANVLEAVGGYYGLALRSASGGTALVVELVAEALPRLARDEAGAPAVFPVRANALTWLPSPPLDLRTPELELPEDAWRRPFLVPRDAGSMRVLLLHRVGAVGEDRLHAIETVLAEFGPVADPLAAEAFQDLRDALRASGFGVQEFLVHEPR